MAVTGTMVAQESRAQQASRFLSHQPYSAAEGRNGRDNAYTYRICTAAMPAAARHCKGSFQRLQGCAEARLRQAGARYASAFTISQAAH